MARWYPSHDAPIAGIFVADLVRALVRVDHDVVVASFDPVHIQGPTDTLARRADRAAIAWGRAVTDPIALSTPRTWGAGVPVARLPIPWTWSLGGAFDDENWIDRHAAVLMSFGRALHARWPFEVIHAHTGLPDGVAASRLATSLGVPLLVSEHDSTMAARLAAKPALVPRYRSLATSATRRLAAVSPALAQRLGLAIGPDVPIEILPNPVDVDAFTPGPPGVRADDELLWVGQRSDHKGTPLLLAAIAEARRRRPNLRARLIGSSAGGDDARWQAMAEELGIGQVVRFEPAADRDAVAAAMRTASVFAHPSPWETFGLVAAEAISSGLPVAATPSGGVEAIVGTDGLAGEVAADSTPEALAEAILAVCDRLPTFDAMAMRASIVRRYGPDHVAAATTALYDRMLGERPPRSADRGHVLDEAHRAGGAVVPPGEPLATIVAGFRPSARRRLEAMPRRALLRSSVVVGPSDPDGPTGTTFTATILDPDADYHRQRAAAVGLLGWLRRRSLARRRRRLQELVRRRVLAEIVRSASPVPSDGPVLVVAVDVDDLLVVLDRVENVVPAPGSLRWLADRDDAG